MIESVEQLKSEYNRLVGDLDFDRLELGLRNPNLFDVLRITKNEIRHSNFLSWLLNPRESHNIDDLFLKRFLREVFSSDLTSNIDQVEVNELELSNVEIRREWKNIDLLILLDDIVVCIENKVLSKEHSNQLTRYRETVESHFPNHRQSFVFLTPEGDQSQDDSDHYSPVSYRFIIDTLDRILEIHGESMNRRVVTYIEDYIKTIERELMDSDELIDLSRRIYKNHREVFDFIYDSKPDIVSELIRILDDLVLEKGYVLGTKSSVRVRFVTPKMKDLIYINQVVKGWGGGESFLFEISFRRDRDELRFQTIIPPCDENFDHVRLGQILREVEGSKKPFGEKWLIHFDRKKKYSFDSVLEKTEEEIRQDLSEFLESNIQLVEQVESKFLEHQDELIKMKSVG